MTAGTVVITGGILAAVILLCIIAVLCYCRLQYYCCKKSREEDADAEEEDHDRPTSPGVPPCNACSSQALDGRGNLAPLPGEPCGQPCGVAARHCATCSPYSSPFYIRTADMVPNGGGSERLSFAPTYYKEGGPSSLQLAAPQSYPVTWPGSGREAFTNPRAISTDV
ncbi:family with sequence similarity 163 member A [Phyllostomus discolor]|nr:protein FAM163A isoform X2 [Phyllostomus discolor]XP_028386771.1 protein FAM163A isoform X2 [Phyllostomus discolor]KAF6074445.1 family with sequence similarity 163 member A [Phyllostomus discolor]